MRLSEAKQILLAEGYKLQDEDFMAIDANINKQEEKKISYKLNELYNLLKNTRYKMKVYYDKYDKNIVIDMHWNKFTVYYHPDYEKYDVYYYYDESYESFDTAQEVVDWLFED